MVTIGPLDKASPSTRFYVTGHVEAIVGNASRVRVHVIAYNGPTGNSSSQYNGVGVQVGSIDGIGDIVAHNGNPFLPAGYAQNQLRWDDSGYYDVVHDANGYHGDIVIRMRITYGSINEQHIGYLALPRIPKPPAAPNAPTVSELTTVGARLSWNIPDNMGAGIDQMLLRYSTDPGLAGATDVALGGGVTTHVLNTLTPGTNYYAAVFAHNSQGYSNRSGITPFTTIPAVAPGMAVIPTLSGTGANVHLTPPGGVTGVTSYIVERRLLPSGSVVSASSPSSPVAVSGLTPGGSYEWRASAMIGAYQSPWTAWSTVVQPNPNTSPGNYFDGSTPTRPDLTFAWLGTVNNSPSEARGVGVRGWRVLADAPNPTPRLQRITGGRAGAFAARMLIISDCTAPGIHLGMQRSVPTAADIEETATYIGSIHVRPSRAQRLAAEIVWLDAAAVVVSTVVGDGTLVTSTSEWTRLVVSANAPAGAALAIVRTVDVAGAGFTPWLGGQWLDADAAMISLSTLFPYFDGSTPDTTDFDYQWLGGVDESVSARFERTLNEVDPLADPDCPPPPAPPSLPTIEADCIDETGTWRRYTLTIPATEVRRWSSTLPTLVLTTGGVAERQVRIRYYGNPDGLAPGAVVSGAWTAEMILTYIPPATEIRMDGVTQKVRASVNGGDYIPADRLLYGTGGVPATWPELRCGIGYVITLDVPLDAPAGNLDTRVSVTQRM